MHVESLRSLGPVEGPTSCLTYSIASYNRILQSLFSSFYKRASSRAIHKIANMATIGKGLMIASNFAYACGAFIADWNETHVLVRQHISNSVNVEHEPDCTEPTLATSRSLSQWTDHVPRCVPLLSNVISTSPTGSIEGGSQG